MEKNTPFHLPSFFGKSNRFLRGTKIFVLLFTAGMVLGITGCKKEFILPDDVREITFLPSETSTQIDQFNDEMHYAWISNTAVLTNHLLVHLPGTFGAPSNSRRFGTLAAQHGLHSLSLYYPNSKAAATACSSSADADCFDNFRQEICYGDQLSGDVDVRPGNDIRSRLIAALEWLNTQYPGEGWGNYLNNGEPVWSNIIISGHSQGSGHAAYIAVHQSVSRCLMFGGPNDYSDHFKDIPNWQKGAIATPAENFYSFAHEDDKVADFALMQPQWDALGLTDAVGLTNIDDGNPPYGSAQALSTAKKSRPRTATHSSVIVDAVTPLDRNGNADFSPVWTYMLGF